ncbi:hypothetical protein HanXRQr2_Chr10g0442891 [Helianthus annuus]|uniref:Uncharacterized protein n=1 Tax=Helianthus annuus TaxID=4232 RepID=A0A9K3HYG0_HELAN|nr:hypothetical protein HanXRQr2_Chr10g0442891 [Helianthus annuus]
MMASVHHNSCSACRKRSSYQIYPPSLLLRADLAVAELSTTAALADSAAEKDTHTVVGGTDTNSENVAPNTLVVAT